MSCRFRHRENARPAGVLALMLLFLTLTACASTPRLDAAVEAELPPRVLLEDVPFHGQRDYQCGPASLAMVLNDAEVPVSVDTLIPQVFLPGREGSVQPEMLATVRRHGRIPYPIAGEFDALLKEIAAGHPVVVMQNLSLPAWPLWHYAVAIGYDLADQKLILHSGLEAAQRVDFARFDATWARSGRWAFVALKPEQWPAAVGPRPALQILSDFERLQGSAAALPAWENLVARHPEFATGQFALGNARHATGDTDGALTAFRAAVKVDPELAAAWLNLGLLLDERGDIPGAYRALSQAAALPGPWQARARQELEGLAEGGNS